MKNVEGVILQSSGDIFCKEFGRLYRYNQRLHGLKLFYRKYVIRNKGNKKIRLT